MSFASLPPELVIALIECAAGDLPSRTETQYKSRRANLRSLSLVNSFFRPIAQSLLMKEIWRPTYDPGLSFVTFAMRIASNPSERAKVQHLVANSLQSPWSSTMEIIRSWASLVSLTVAGLPSMVAIVKLSELNGFPRKAPLFDP